MELQIQLDQKDLQLMHAKDSLEREKMDRKLYEEGKDELIFDLESKLSRTIEELKVKEQEGGNIERFKIQLDSLSKQVDLLNEEIDRQKKQSQQKDNQLAEQERKLFTSTEVLERERQNWRYMQEEKDLLIEELRRKHSEHHQAGVLSL